MISSADRALEILKIINASSEPMSVTEIARKLELGAGTVFRSLDALERTGYVARFQSSSRYVLGSTVNKLQHSLLSRFRIREVSLPYLRQLAFATGETASLTVMVGWYGLRLVAAPGTTEVTSSPPTGQITLLEQTAAGRAMLAYFTPRRLHAYQRWAKNKPGERTSIKIDDLETIQTRGFALDIASSSADQAGVAFAILDRVEPIAAISIEGPVIELNGTGSDEKVSQWREVVETLARVVRNHPAAFANPFAHVDPDTIRLATAPAAK